MKQRLVGATVLVALAVIFLPMLLDGSGQSGPHQIAIEIPAEPQPPANRLEPPQDLAAPPAPDSATRDHAPAVRSAEARPSSEVAEDAARSTEAGPRPEEDGATTSARAEGDDDAADGGDARAQVDAAPGPSAWVVQVGSFARETNALVLRDRLRAADFDAFAERADTSERTVWRVRIGPVSTREQARQLSQRLEQERGEPALVMAHP